MTPESRETTVERAAVFTAGDGTRFGLVTLAGSSQVVVFKRHAERWVGHVEFNDRVDGIFANGKGAGDTAKKS